MTRVYLALGSNLTDPLQQIQTAITGLATIPQTQLINCSPFYRSKPLGPQDQPDYLNAVVALDTALSPEELLDNTQAIEQQQGRIREGKRWGARTLDIDILLYGDKTVHSSRLTIPHYDMENREFMLYPLADLAPQLILPNGTPLAQLLLSVPINGMTLW